MLIPALISFDAIDRADLNHCLQAWGHRMGEWKRPNYGDEIFHGLRHHGELVGVTAAAGLIAPTGGGLLRSDAFELGRVCASRPHLCRAVVRLWREFVFPAVCAARGWRWVISYQDAVIHTGDLYRHDGWVCIGFSRSGHDARSGRRGRSKVVWGWCANPTERQERECLNDVRRLSPAPSAAETTTEPR